MDANTSTPIINELVAFLQENPNAVLIVFIISAIANVIQIGTYFRDRRRLRQQDIESQKLIKLVDTYEYILNIAQKNLDTEEKLIKVEKDINAKTQQVNELSERIKMVQASAQRALVSQAIEYNLGVLKEAHEEVKRLREQYKSLGELPDVPEASREIIEEEVQIAVKRPYGFPRPFVFKSVLIVLLIALLGPASGLVVPFLIQPMVVTFIEAVSLFPNEKLQRFVRQRVFLISYLFIFCAWFYVISSAMFFISILIPPSLFTEQIPSIFYILFLPLILLVSYQHWRILRFDIHKAVNKMLTTVIPNKPTT